MSVSHGGTDPIAFVITENLHRRHLANRQKAFSYTRLSVGFKDDARGMHSGVGRTQRHLCTASDGARMPASVE